MPKWLDRMDILDSELDRYTVRALHRKYATTISEISRRDNNSEIGMASGRYAHKPNSSNCFCDMCHMSSMRLYKQTRDSNIHRFDTKCGRCCRTVNELAHKDDPRHPSYHKECTVKYIRCELCMNPVTLFSSVQYKAHSNIFREDVFIDICNTCNSDMQKSIEFPAFMDWAEHQIFTLGKVKVWQLCACISLLSSAIYVVWT